MFGPHAMYINITRKTFTFRYRSPAHWLDVFRGYYGPVLKAFEALEPAQRSALSSDLLALIDRFNAAADGTMAAPAEYLEVVIIKR